MIRYHIDRVVCRLGIDRVLCRLGWHSWLYCTSFDGSGKVEFSVICRRCGKEVGR